MSTATAPSSIASDPDRLDWDALVAEGREVAEANDSSSWTLGKLAQRVETTYGDGDLQKFADAIGVNAETLRDYRYVVARFVDRSTFCSFTVMRQIARIDDPAERLATMQQAEREHWTVSRARRAIAQRNEQPAPDPEPRRRKSGGRQETDKVADRFRTIAAAFGALQEDEAREDAEPEQLARTLTANHDRRRAVQSAVDSAKQFVDKWSSILEMEVTPQSEFE